MLSTYTETTFALDADKQLGILHQYEQIQQKIAAGVQVSESTLSGINQAIAQSFDNRPTKQFRTMAMQRLLCNNGKKKRKLLYKSSKRKIHNKKWNNFIYKVKRNAQVANNASLKNIALKAMSFT